jgi:hypothetical protein
VRAGSTGPAQRPMAPRLRSWTPSQLGTRRQPARQNGAWSPMVATGGEGAHLLKCCLAGLRTHAEPRAHYRRIKAECLMGKAKIACRTELFTSDSHGYDNACQRSLRARLTGDSAGSGSRRVGQTTGVKRQQGYPRPAPSDVIRHRQT